MIRTLVAEAVTAGARRWRACEVLGLSVRCVERWGTSDDDGRHGPNHAPVNKLSAAERQKAVAVMTFDEARDAQAVVSPRPGRLVLFDGALLHAGRSPSRICREPRLTLAMKYVPTRA